MKGISSPEFCFPHRCSLLSISFKPTKMNSKAIQNGENESESQRSNLPGYLHHPFNQRWKKIIRLKEKVEAASPPTRMCVYVLQPRVLLTAPRVPQVSQEPPAQFIKFLCPSFGVLGPMAGLFLCGAGAEMRGG